MNHLDAAHAIRIANSSDRARELYFASTSDNDAVRCAAALNLHTDWEELERLSKDKLPMIAELAQARIQGLEHLRRLLGDWSKTNMEASFYTTMADLETVTIVRHLARTVLTEMTFGQALELLKASEQER